MVELQDRVLTRTSGQERLLARAVQVAAVGEQGARGISVISIVFTTGIASSSSSGGIARHKRSVFQALKISLRALTQSIGTIVVMQHMGRVESVAAIAGAVGGVLVAVGGRRGR